MAKDGLQLPDRLCNIRWVPSVRLELLIQGGVTIYNQPVYVGRRAIDGDVYYQLGRLARSSENWSTIAIGEERWSVRNTSTWVPLFWDGVFRLPPGVTESNIPAGAMN